MPLRGGQPLQTPGAPSSDPCRYTYPRAGGRSGHPRVTIMACQRKGCVSKHFLLRPSCPVPALALTLPIRLYACSGLSTNLLDQLVILCANGLGFVRVLWSCCCVCERGHLTCTNLGVRMGPRSVILVNDQCGCTMSNYVFICIIDSRKRLLRWLLCFVVIREEEECKCTHACMFSFIFTVNGVLPIYRHLLKLT